MGSDSERAVNVRTRGVVTPGNKRFTVLASQADTMNRAIQAPKPASQASERARWTSAR